MNKFEQRTRHGRWMKAIGQGDLASIIIPTYNRASLLNETLASAAAQTYRPLEIVVVDDGSADGTPGVVNYWQEQLKDDPRAIIRYFYQANSGVGSARNRGLIESSGEFIQFLDSDDILNSEKLNLHIGCLRRFPESGFAFSDMAKIEDPKKWGRLCVDQANMMESAEFYCSPKMLTMVGVYRRATCHAAGPWAEDMNLGEDEEYNLRALCSTGRLVYLPGNLCAFRDHSGPRLTDPQKDQRGLILAMRAYRRMAESAASEGRLSDPRLVSALIRRLNDVIVPSLETGRRDLVDEAIQTCRNMPVGIGRRVRLGIYQIFNWLPGGVFSRLWPLWLNFRHAVFEIPYRETCRLRNAWQTKKQNA